MWIFTEYGFFSIVCPKASPDIRKATTPDNLDLDNFMIRARSKDHLIRLKERFHFALKDCKITSSEITDYPFRIFVPVASFMTLVSLMVSDIDYGNFKSRIEQKFGIEDRYPKALHRIWAAGMDIEVPSPNKKMGFRYPMDIAEALDRFEREPTPVSLPTRKTPAKKQKKKGKLNADRT